MKFFDVRRGAPGANNQPAIRASKTTVMITIPSAIAEEIGLRDAKNAKIQFGTDGDKAAIKIVPDNGSAWSLVHRKSVTTIAASELRPTTPVEFERLSYEIDGKSIVLSLPAWQLANEAVLVGAASGRSSRAK